MFNNSKLKFVIFWKKRMAFPTDRGFLIRSNGKSIKQEENIKLLGITIDQNLTWTDQINNLVKTLYSKLQVLKRFKRFTPYKTKKTLAESLILSKLNYCNIIYAQVPQYLLNRLQRLQTCAAGYVFQKYAKTKDVIDLKWLPIEENISYNIARYCEICFQSFAYNNMAIISSN